MKTAATTSFALIALASVSFGGCGSDDEPVQKGHKGKSDSPPELIGASGVAIHQVAIYQGVKRTLMLEGAPGTSTVPLVAGRDAVVRIFYGTDAGYDGAEVTARLEIEGGDPIDVTGVLGAGSSDEDMASTVNFVVPGDRIGDSLSYSVGLLQEKGKGDVDNVAAHWPAADKEVIAVDGKKNTLRIVMAPFQYNTDGSGRLPDTSPEAIERFKQRFMQLYPISNVEITVRQPTPWNQAIGPDGSGWQQVGFALYNFRGQDGVTDDVYYYGIFNPRASFNQYCGGGCLLGVTLLNNDPPDTGSVGLRLALGVGFEEYATDTAAHEIGHAHGREHAPCGPGLDPQSIDKSYPHPMGQIGEWGLDPKTLTLYPPTTTTDIMGYCDNTWISDHNYLGLFNRTKNVNLPYWHTSSRTRGLLVALDGQGGAAWGGETLIHGGQRGTAVTGELVLENGERSPTVGQYYPYDHLPGGWVLLPKPSRAAVRAELEVEGARITVAP